MKNGNVMMKLQRRQQCWGRCAKRGALWGDAGGAGGAGGTKYYYAGVQKGKVPK